MVMAQASNWLKRPCCCHGRRRDDGVVHTSWRLSAAAVQHFGGGFRDWLDLSTGINPVPWQGQVEIDWHPLPAAQDLAELEAAAAQHFGVAPQFCCAVPGSEMALRLMGAMAGARRLSLAVLSHPCFGFSRRRCGRY
jgi:histidinol-phosphate/aromatic aminotransferase/cobyric acid decarboxylase-like protein